MRRHGKTGGRILIATQQNYAHAYSEPNTGIALSPFSR
jgi:hypothetical protein